MEEIIRPEKNSPIVKVMNIAYIDGANLDKNLKNHLGWQLDYKKFRIWLEDKYCVAKSYIFLGHIPSYGNLYRYLEYCGFALVFKETIYTAYGKPKGNCDSDLIVQAMTDLYEGDLLKAVVVSSDGDYTPLIKVLSAKEKIQVILSPGTPETCSLLLKRIGVPIAYIGDHRSILERFYGIQNEKAPGQDLT